MHVHVYVCAYLPAPTMPCIRLAIVHIPLKTCSYSFGHHIFSFSFNTEVERVECSAHMNSILLAMLCVY